MASSVPQKGKDHGWFALSLCVLEFKDIEWMDEGQSISHPVENNRDTVCLSCESRIL